MAHPYDNAALHKVRHRSCGSAIVTFVYILQLGRRWYQHFVDILENGAGMKRSNTDQAVFYCRDGPNCLIILLVHVNNCTLVVKPLRLIKELKTKISEFVEIMDLGELGYILGIEAQCNRQCCVIRLSHCAYIDTIVHCFQLKDLKPFVMPMEPHQ